MSLARSSFLFTMGTVLSRLSGLIRDMILTGVFGASSGMESFLVANRIPNLFRDMLAEGALGSSFTKVYTATETKDQERAHMLLCDAFRAGALFLVFVSVMGWFLSPWLVEGFTFFSTKSGRPADFQDQTIGLTKLIFPFLGFSVLAALAGGVLQQRGRFFLTAWSSAALNVGYIIGALVFSKLAVENLSADVDARFADREMIGLAIGVLLGGFLHFSVQFYVIWRELIKPRGWKIHQGLISKDLRHVFKLMAPAAIAASAGSINLLVNTNFATSLGTGAVTWLNYAFRILQLPIGIFAVAVGSVTLPALTRAVAKAGNKVDGAASVELQNACEFICWLMMPCLVFLIVNSLPTIQLLFQHGRYDAASAGATADALFAYAFGVMGYGLIKVLSSFYYAVERTGYAMRVSLFTVFANFFLNAAFVNRWGHVGLAATSSVTLSLNALLLLWGLRTHRVQWRWPELGRSTALLVAAAAVALLGQFAVLGGLRALDFGPLDSLKLRAAMEISAGGLVVAGVFCGAALWRLQWSPAYAFGKIRKFRK